MYNNKLHNINNRIEKSPFFFLLETKLLSIVKCPFHFGVFDGVLTTTIVGFIRN